MLGVTLGRLTVAMAVACGACGAGGSSGRLAVEVEASGRLSVAVVVDGVLAVVGVGRSGRLGLG